MLHGRQTTLPPTLCSLFNRAIAACLRLNAGEFRIPTASATSRRERGGEHVRSSNVGSSEDMEKSSSLETPQRSTPMPPCRMSRLDSGTTWVTGDVP
jgi:hypothetical protein